MPIDHYLGQYFFYYLKKNLIVILPKVTNFFLGKINKLYIEKHFFFKTFFLILSKVISKISENFHNPKDQ